jgi:hypothetical protein
MGGPFIRLDDVCFYLLIHSQMSQYVAAEHAF